MEEEGSYDDWSKRRERDNRYEKAIIMCIKESDITQLVRLIQESSDHVYFGHMAMFCMIKSCYCWYYGLKILLKAIPGLDVNAWDGGEWSGLSHLIDRDNSAYNPMILLFLEYGARIDPDPPSCSIRYKCEAYRWKEAHKNAIVKCRRACLTVLWVTEKMSPMMKEPLKMVARMILKTKLKRYWK